MIKKILFAILISPLFAIAQENTEPTATVDKPVKHTFSGEELINNQTVMGLNKNTLEFMIQHRFGVIKDEANMFGLFDPANIRFGLNYGITNELAVGAGVTKNKHVYDLNAKYVVLKQTKSNRIPVSVAAFGEMSISNLKKENFTNQKGEYDMLNRYSYFSELMVARKFDEHISAQVAFTYSYFNIVPVGIQNGFMSASVLARYKFSNQSSIIIDFDYPITQATDKKFQPKPNIGIGLEVATSGHHFQIFITTADGILNNETRMFNQNDFTEKQIVLGFNINRLWGF